jgi:hypothetical protein
MRSEPTEHLAAQLQRRGLSAAARLLLDAHRPLRPLLAQAGIFLSPLGLPLLGRTFSQVRALLDDGPAYDALVERLGRGAIPTEEAPEEAPPARANASGAGKVR